MPPKFRNITTILISVCFFYFLYLQSDLKIQKIQIPHEPSQKENEGEILHLLKKHKVKEPQVQQEQEKGEKKTDEGESMIFSDEINSLADLKVQEKLELMLEQLTQDGGAKLEQILSELRGKNKSNGNKDGENLKSTKSEQFEISRPNYSNHQVKDAEEEKYVFQSSINSTSSISSSQFENAANQNFKLDQSDPRILEYIREHHLWPPTPVAYKLKKPLEDPTRREGQNKVVLGILKEMRNGIFVEAGANDGEFLSNTLALERDFGWTGILVEPDRKAFQALQTKHRKAWTSNACLSVTPTPEKVKFLQFKSTSTWSKIAKVSDHHKKWKKEQMEEVEVNCFPFYSLVLALNMTTIDYFSLDIEGAELEILKTIPFDKVLIKTLSIEYDHIRLIPGADLELKTLMEANGYKLVTEVTKGFAQDYIYAHKSVLEEDHGNMTTKENKSSPRWLQKHFRNS